MIRILATGTLHTEPTSRTSANGNPYTTAKLRADDGKGGSVWCNLIAFGEAAERVAIGKAVEEELGKRQGQRTDLVTEEQEEMFGELRQNFAEVEPGKRTDEIAASKSGFGNKETYRQAKTVTENATPGYWPPSNRSHPPPTLTDRCNPIAVAH